MGQAKVADSGTRVAAISAGRNKEEPTGGNSDSNVTFVNTTTSHKTPELVLSLIDQLSSLYDIVDDTGNLGKVSIASVDRDAVGLLTSLQLIHI
ncbi:hypothetical protein ACFX10_019410 [Malus domestica]